MQNIINSFKANLYERTSSPLVGSFIFYWVLCNYKFILVILDGDLKVLDKFKIIDASIYPQFIDKVFIGLVYPLILTLIYIFIIPYFTKFVYKYSHQKQKELKEIKQKIDEATPMSKEQSKKILEDFKNLEDKYYSLLHKNDNNNNNFFDGITTSTISNNIKIDEYSKQILLHLAESPNSYLSASSINGTFEEVKSKTDYYLEELNNNQFIANKYDNNLKENTYEIYQKGREYLVKNKLI